MRTEIILQGSKDDKNNLIIALINSGYTVRTVDRKEEGKRGTVKVVQYWREEQ